MASEQLTCRTCGSPLTRGAAFCAMCGSRVGATPASDRSSWRDTMTSFRLQRVQRRILGLPLTIVLMVAAAAGLVFALILLATGAWPVGLVVLVLAIVCAAALLWAPERPDWATEDSLRALEQVRSLARLPVVSAVAWTRAGRALLPLRRHLRRLNLERWARVHELGEAVLRDDAAAVEVLREQVRAIEAEIDELQKRIAEVVVAFRQHVQQERLAVQPTLAREEPPRSAG